MMFMGSGFMAVTGLMSLWVLTIFTGGGPIGLPLSVPPLPENPTLGRVAPEECFYYLSWSGQAEPDAASENHTEQLLAEAEVQQGLEMLVDLASRAFVDGTPNTAQGKVISAEAPQLVRTFLARPVALYVGKVGLEDGKPYGSAGLVVAFETVADARRFESSIAKLYQAILGMEPARDAGGWHAAPQMPGAPPVAWGARGKYFVLGVGEGEADAILKRGQGETPAWLADIRAKLPVERVSMVSYLNIDGILQQVDAVAGAPLSQMIRGAGLGNLQHIANVSGLDATGVKSQTLFATEGEATGVLSALAGEPLTADHLSRIPSDATIGGAIRIDPRVVLEQFRLILGAMDARAVQEFDRGLASFKTEVGVDFEKDVVDSLGDTWSFYINPNEGGPLLGMVAAVDVRDLAGLRRAEKSFVQILQREATRFRQSAALKQLEHDEYTIHYFTAAFDAPMPFAWCLTEDEFVFASSPQAIQTHLSRPADAPSLAEYEPIAEALAGSDGPQMIVYRDTPAILRMVYPLAQFGLHLSAREMREANVDLSMLPPQQTLAKHLAPGVMIGTWTEDGLLIRDHGRMPIVGGLTAFTPLMAGVSVPAIFQGRLAARNSQSMNNLKMIGLAMHNHHDVFKQFPPAAGKPKGGKLSWRVHLLPFFEENALFQQFKLDEDWDSPHNKKLIARMPSVYMAPGSKVGAEGRTVYLGIRDPASVVNADDAQSTLADIADGSSNTAMVVEVSDDDAVIWTKPDDLELDEDDPGQAFRKLDEGVFRAVLADGAARAFPTGASPAQLLSLFRRDDGGSFERPVGETAPVGSVEGDDLEVREAEEPLRDSEFEEGAAEPTEPFEGIQLDDPPFGEE